MTFEKRILVIDNEKPVVTILSKALSRYSTHPVLVIDQANTPTVALQKAKENRYDLIISDYHMPDMNGLDLIQQLRQQKSESQFLLMSAYDSTEMLAKVKNANIAGFICKPFRLEEIREVVYRILSINIDNPPPVAD